jgi:uncharacterized protein YndB with AHSA1/START domain
MTQQRTVAHGTFSLERTYPASPARVFRAFADPKQKAQWFRGPAEWVQETRDHDFRVGGHERAANGPTGGPMHVFTCTYEDIVPDARIVYTYTMHSDATKTSVSIATIEFHPAGAGTRLVMTEHGVFLDGHDIPGQREAGTEGLLDKLGAFLEAQAEAA